MKFLLSCPFFGIKAFQRITSSIRQWMFCDCGRAGERVLVEVSRKFTVGDFNHLANESRFVIDMAWRDQTANAHTFQRSIRWMLACN